MKIGHTLLDTDQSTGTIPVVDSTNGIRLRLVDLPTTGVACVKAVFEIQTDQDVYLKQGPVTQGISAKMKRLNANYIWRVDVDDVTDAYLALLAVSTSANVRVTRIDSLAAPVTGDPVTALVLGV